MNIEPEKNIKRIEEISAILSSPDVDMSTAMSLFEEGVELIKANYEELKRADGKITELKKELNKYSEIKFDEE